MEKDLCSIEYQGHHIMSRRRKTTRKKQNEAQESDLPENQVDAPLETPEELSLDPAETEETNDKDQSQENEQEVLMNEELASQEYEADQFEQPQGEAESLEPEEQQEAQTMVSQVKEDTRPELERTHQSEEEFKVSENGAPAGRGLDVGTANLVGAHMDASGEIQITPVRNAFLDIPEDPFTKKMLLQQNIPYIKRGSKLYVVGEAAFELANIFNREMRRPMKNGLISPKDADAMPMEVELVKQVLGEPRVPGEAVYYSVPADPVDSTMNIVYHQNIFSGLLERLGFRGNPLNEGHAVVFSELGEEEFTGIGISCGGGMVNVCVAFRSMPVVSFATSKGGDWIDQQAAQVMGCAASKITAVKERGVTIDNPTTPEENAICIYYRHLINYSLTKIIEKFSQLEDVPNFPKEISIVISGGTSKVGGFIDVFKKEFSQLQSQFPIKIGDIRRAEDALNSTAKGCLLAALAEE